MQRYEVNNSISLRVASIQNHRMKPGQKIGSRIVHQRERFELTQSHVPPLHLTSSFDYNSVEKSIEVFEGQHSGHVYSRYGNPNVASIAQKVADLESFYLDQTAKALFTTNGMSAIYTVLRALLSPGDAILTQGNLYGGTTELILKVLGKTTHEQHLTDFDDMNQVEDLLKKNKSIKLIYLETPTNPTCSVVPLNKIANLARKYNCVTVVDNTFCTPYLQRPLEHNIDFVVHSTTKYLNGHGTGLGGCIVGNEDRTEWAKIWEVMKLIGSTGSPFEAWMVSNGIKTLRLRMDQHCKNALQLARFLNGHELVGSVHYPGLEEHPQHELARKQMDQFGAMLSFEVTNRHTAFQIMNTLQLATIAPTLGDVDTLVLHPATSSHLKVDNRLCQQYGITDGLIRVSVGIEDGDDIVEDFKQALEKV